MAKKKAVVEETVTTTADTTSAEATLEPVQLTLQDMNAIANVIDLASRRGAFHANEMSAVGNVYNKLNGFLQYVAATQSKEKADQESVEAAQAAAE
jgi:hypothetical protein